MEEKKTQEVPMGGCNYKKNLNNPKCFLNICNSVSFLKNMGILKVIIQTEKNRCGRKARQDAGDREPDRAADTKDESREERADELEMEQQTGKKQRETENGSTQKGNAC